LWRTEKGISAFSTEAFRKMSRRDLETSQTEQRTKTSKNSGIL